MKGFTRECTKFSLCGLNCALCSMRVGGKLTRIHYTDETNRLYVTEDVEYLENKLWSELCRLRWFERD